MSIAGTDDGEHGPRTTDPSAAPTGPAAVRPGPAQLPADSWDTPLAQPDPGGGSGAAPWIPSGPKQAAGESVPGHRRSDPPRRRRLLAIGLVLLALAAVVIVPLVWSGSDDDNPVAAPTATSAATARTQAQPGGDVSLVPATGAPGVTTPPATTTARVVAPKLPNANPVRTTTPPPPAPVTFEAEGPDVTITGSAFVDAYPGASKGSIVRNLGRWDDNPGTVRFNSVVIPTPGTYIFTFYAVHLDGEPTRSALITVSGADPLTVTFSASATCCTPTGVTVVLAAGTHSVTVGNASGHAPSLDKLVVSRQ